MKTFFEEMRDAGLITGSHESDLYTLDTPEAREIAKRHGMTITDTFTDQTTGKRSLDFFGQFAPFWEKKLKHSKA